MFDRLYRWLRPIPTRTRLAATDGPRLVVDFSGTHRCEPPAVLLRDASLELLEHAVRLGAPGTSIVVVGLHLVPGRADDHARWVARTVRRSNGVDLYFDLSTAGDRWRRRFAGNLHRFGCIERDEALSHIDALPCTRASDVGPDFPRDHRE